MMENIHSSLNIWLEDVFSQIISEDEVVNDCSTLDSRIKILGAFIFSLSYESTLEEVKTMLSESLDVEVTVLTDNMTVIEACLVCAVSQICENRAIFVQRIMAMDPAVQNHLMQAIKGNMQRYKTKSEPDNKVDMQTREQYNRSNNVLREESTCPNCCGKDKEIKYLNEQLSKNFKKEGETENQLRTDLIEKMKKLADAELSLLDREDQLNQKDIELEKQTSKISELSQKLSLQTTLSLQVSKLQDELDILRPIAQRADVAEAQMEKLRERLDELAGAKQQLKAESAAHSETHSRLLEVQREVESLRKYKKDVDEYRNLYAELSIRSEELTLRLSQKEQEVGRLSQQIEAMNDVHSGQSEASQRLQAELCAAQTQLQEMGRGVGIGDGISELNPRVAAELEKLRVENKELSSRLDASSLSALDRLETQLADEKTKCSSLQLKWMASKDAHNEALSLISNLRNELATLRTNHSELEQRFVDSSLMLTEDGLALSLRTTRLNRIRQRFEEDSRRLYCEGKSKLSQELAAKLDRYQELLHAKRLEYTMLEDANLELSQRLNDIQEELETTKMSMAQMSIDAKADLVRVQEEYARQAVEMKSTYEHRVTQLQEEHAAILGAEVTNSKALMEDLEDERLKRRRAEREKKIMENELYRYRSQQQQGVDGDGPSLQAIQAAMKEIRTMQAQLDSANAELTSLRSCGTVTASDAPVAVGEGTTKDPAGKTLMPGRAGPLGAMRIRKSEDPYAGFGSCLDPTDLTERRTEQLQKERREMIANSLEENSKIIEMKQELLLKDQKIATLKARVTQLTLDKERVELKLLSKGCLEQTFSNNENAVNYSNT